MASHNSQQLWRATLLSVIDAIVFTGVLFGAEKVFHYHGWPHAQIFWPATFVILAVCFAVPTYIIHRLLSARLKSPVSTWVLIGIVAMVTWNIFFLGLGYWELRSQPFSAVYQEVTTWQNPMFGFISVALVIGTNAIFGVLLKFALSQYRMGAT